MFTDPQMVSSSKLEDRAYVKVYINGIRHRFYNGKGLGINCNPNHCKTIKERYRALSKICFTLRKKLESGWLPSHESHKDKPAKILTSTGEHIAGHLEELKQQELSDLYKRDLESVGEAFLQYLKANDIFDLPIAETDAVLIEDFLKQYKHSSTYYMNKRRTLGAIFSRILKKKVITNNPVYETTRVKEKATLHKAYTKLQLNSVLAILENEHPNLHLCALLMYGCFLRPHQEIRQLFRKDLNEDCSAISLGGYGNKGGKVRTVHIPVYVRELLLEWGVETFSSHTNLFTRTVDVYNESYFNTAWSRLKEKMMREGLIIENHTLYSFRHTAAINLYMKTKDIFKVQQAMGHSSMTVTLTYMRSLGFINTISPDDSPDL